MNYFHARKIILAACANALVSSVVFGDYDVPNATYAPNGTYYNTASGIGATLKFNLNEIIDGHTVRTYSNSLHDQAMLACDEDFNNSNNVTLIYNGVSIAKSLVLNTNYNREHMWPQSYGLDGVNPAYSDLYNLRVCDMNVNSDRNNDYYDDVPVGIRVVGNPEAPNTWEDNADTMWEPMAVEKGEIARAMFYMDTRYEGQVNDGANPNLTLTDTIANITTSNSNMGRLSTLLKWNYDHGVSNRERRRNHLLYTNTTWGQGNRNPFVDHPEYVWAVYGPGTNDSKLYVSASAPSNGTSVATVDLGKVIVGSSLGTGNFTLTKAGANPTTYDLTVGGEATTTAAGTGQPMPYDPTSRVVTVGLTTSTATPGLKTGTVTIDNTDITGANGTGTGSTDGNDTVTVNANVVSHSKPSLNSSSQQTSLTLNFGTVAQGTGTQSLPFGVSNLVVTAGFTAGLDLDGISGTGNTGTLTTNFATLSNLSAGLTQAYNALINTTTNGIYSATYTITNSDENIPGATNGTNLSLTITGTVKTRQWNINSNGTWSTSANWLGPVPTATGDTANFWNVITAPHTVTLDGNKSVGTMSFDSSFKYTIAGANTLTLISGSGATVTVVSGSHDITAPVVLGSNTSFNIPTSSTLKINDFQDSNFNLTKTGIGTLQVNAARTAAMTISAGKIEVPANGSSTGVSKVTSLTISPTAGGYLGTLDLNDNDLVIDYGAAATPYTQVVNMVKSGMTEFAGNGSGITSTEVNNDTLPGAFLAVVDNAYIEGGITSLSNFSSFSSNSVLVKYTWFGDANLDGVVDGADYALVDTGFTSGGALGTWIFGDFDYNGVIDGGDYGLLDTGFIAQTGTLPEPATLGLLLLSATGLLSRRHNR